MEISLNQKSFLAEKVKHYLTPDPEQLWKAMDRVDEKTYRFLLALYYNEPDNFKYEINQLLNT